MELQDLSSNWKKLQASLNADKSATKLAPHPGLKRKRSGKSNPVKPSSRRIGENDDRLVDYVEDVITNIELPPDFVSLDLHQSAKSPNRRQLTNSAPAPRLERATRMASINAINAG